MPTETTQHPLYFIGIDGGGSKCRATLVDQDNKILGTAVAGPANPLHGFDRAVDSITQSALLALDDAGLDRAHISALVAGVGLAGVNLPSLYQQVNDWSHPFARMYLTTDLHIASLAAHNGEDGAVVIAGTGSCGYAHVDGKNTVIGAHGFPHGDKGSGAWIGLEALKAVLLALDNIHHQTSLTNKLLGFLQCNDALELVEKMAGKASCDFARLAPLVFDAAEHDDATATAIIKDGAAYIDRVIAQLAATGAPRISMIGGLGDILLPWLSDKSAQLLSPALAPPEMGSTLYAMQQHADAS